MTEDKALCSAQQRNLNMGVFVNGQMHSKMEKGPLYFQHLVREAVNEHHAKEQKAQQEITPAQQQLPFNAKVSEMDAEFCAGLSCQQSGLEW